MTSASPSKKRKDGHYSSGVILDSSDRPLKRARKEQRVEEENKSKLIEDIETFTVKSALGLLLIQKALLPRINECVILVTQLVWEASRLLNLHCLRMIEEHNLTPFQMFEIDQTFVGRAFQLVSTGSQASRKKSDDLDALETTFIKYYLPCRPPGVHWRVPRRDYLTPIYAHARNDFLVNWKNHVLTNFRGWQRKWYLFFVSQNLKRFTAKKQQWPIVDAMYNATIYSEGDVRYKKLEPDELKLCQDLVTKVRVELHSVLPITTYSLKTNWYCFLPWMRVMLKTFESNPNVKGHRTFTLCPHPSAALKHIAIDATSLRELIVVTSERNQDFKKKFGSPNKEKVIGDKDNWFRQMFKIPNETKTNRKFAHFIRTDGISCSLTMSRPKRADEDQKEKKNQEEALVAGASSDSPRFEHVDCSPQTHRIIGVDPGRGDIFVAICKEDIGSNGKPRVIRYSNERYATESGARYAKEKSDHWLKKAPNNFLTRLHALGQTPSGVTSTAAYQVYLRAALALFPEQLMYEIPNRRRRLRFKSYVSKQKTLDRMCQAITAGDKKTVVAYGAGTFSSCSKGYAPAPNRGLRDRLKLHAKVVMIDEYCTSKLCYKCKKELGALKLSDSKKQEANREAKEEENMEMETEEEVKRKAELRRQLEYKVRVCNDCRMIVNRDVNGANAILNNFLYSNEHQGERIEEYKRKPRESSTNA